MNIQNQIPRKTLPSDPPYNNFFEKVHTWKNLKWYVNIFEIKMVEAIFKASSDKIYH